MCGIRSIHLLSRAACSSVKRRRHRFLNALGYRPFFISHCKKDQLRDCKNRRGPYSWRFRHKPNKHERNGRDESAAKLVPPDHRFGKRLCKRARLSLGLPCAEGENRPRHTTFATNPRKMPNAVQNCHVMVSAPRILAGEFSAASIGTVDPFAPIPRPVGA